MTQLMTWPTIEAVIQGSRLTLLYGPPGTGKTTAAVNAGRPASVFNVTLTDETPAAELRGHYIPRGGEFVWLDGPAVRAFKTGSRLVLNEIDHASADCLDFLHGLLDDPGVSAMTLPTGETIRPDAGFTVVATMNGSPEDLPPAIRDRFAVAVECTVPHPAAVASLPEDLRPAAAAIDPSPERPVTLRALHAYAALRESVGESTAGAAVFAHRAGEVADALALEGSR